MDCQGIFCPEWKMERTLIDLCIKKLVQGFFNGPTHQIDEMLLDLVFIDLDDFAKLLWYSL